MGRAEHITRNAKYAVAGELLLAVLKFVSRRVFALLLGREYLGLGGLFTDVFSMLSLAELGFSVSITYSLYRPVAQGDTEMVKSLIQLYRRVYRAVGLVVLAVGLSLAPFLGFFVKEMPKGIPHIPLIYVLHLINASIPYFFAHNSTLLFVHQKKYVETAARSLVSLVGTAAQLGVLLLTRDYLHYLLLGIVATVVQGAAVSVQTGRLYPYLWEGRARPLPGETVTEIRRNVRAMLLHRVGTVVVFNTDSLLISKLVGVAEAGLYSNYMMVRGFLNVLAGALFDAITPALGDLAATGEEGHKQEAFLRLNFFSAWLFGWMGICLFCLYDPFINIWLGEGYLLPKPAVLLIVANFYVGGMRVPVNNTKGVLGLFWDDRYKSIAEAVLNLAVSAVLAQYWGVAGIMAGTLVSTLAAPFWCEPLVLYRRGLGMPARRYFIGYLAHLAATAVAGGMTWQLCRMVDGGFGGFLWKCLSCAVAPHAVYLLVYRKREELLFFLAMAKRVIRKAG